MVKTVPQIVDSKLPELLYRSICFVGCCWCGCRRGDVVIGLQVRFIRMRPDDVFALLKGRVRVRYNLARKRRLPTDSTQIKI